MKILLKLRCFGDALKMCMWFGYTSKISFVTGIHPGFISKLLLSKCKDSGHLVIATPSTSSHYFIWFLI